MSKLTVTELVEVPVSIAPLMPRMNGLETLDAIKKFEHLKHIPVIMFSGGDLDSFQEKARELGVSYCLRKSIDMLDNLDKIRIIIEKILVQIRNSTQ